MNERPQSVEAIIDRIAENHRRKEAGEMSVAAEGQRIGKEVIAQLNQLIVSATEERHKVPGDYVHVVHYTSLATLFDILDATISGRLPAATPRSFTRALDAAMTGKPTRVGYLRMYGSSRSNDPNEGRYLFKHCDNLSGTLNDMVKIEPARYAYTASFIQPTSETRDAADDLKFWDRYGQHGRGCSLTLRLPTANLKKVRYGSKCAAEACKAITDAISNAETIIDAVHNTRNEAGIKATSEWFEKVLPGLVQAMAYLYKDPNFTDENECRFLIMPDDPKAPQHRIDFIKQGPRKGTFVRYVESELLRADGLAIFKQGDVITLGHSVKDAENAKFNIEEMLLQAGLSGPVVRQSQIEIND